LLEGSVDRGCVERLLPPHHLHDGYCMVVILFHQILARLHRILLSHDGSQTKSDGEDGNYETNENRNSLSVVRRTASTGTLELTCYSPHALWIGPRGPPLRAAITNT
jgi:hypothetical protein